jgi:phenylalanine-4-hydroxylase
MAAVRAQQGDGTGLTTTKAPFIEQAQQEGRLYIHQPYELYSEANHAAWSKLFARMEDRWRRYANPRFLQGIDSLCLEPTRVPRLEDVNRFLSPLTGFKAKAVSGYIPSFLFFDSLRNREFPTTITIRDGATLDYLPEPDIFHDVFGHVPLHSHPVFANFLQQFGAVAAEAQSEQDIIAMARLFWFTVEFGLIREDGAAKIYGSGLISSHGDAANALGPKCDRRPFNLDNVLAQPFEIDHFQDVLFMIDSFDQLFEAVNVVRGRLARGLPAQG